MEITLLILSLSTLLSLIFIGFLFNKNIKLQREISEMKFAVEKVTKEQEELVSIDIGDKAIIPNYGLTYKDEDSFKVTYEVEILEVSEDKVKVKSIDYTTTDKIAKDPQIKPSILAFIDGKWIEKSTIELIVDEQMRRDRKLKQILN
jgi:hypothetical protein